MANLIHFYGDSHQLLHVADLVTSKFPNGDKGGNLSAEETSLGSTVIRLASPTILLGAHSECNTRAMPAGRARSSPSARRGPNPFAAGLRAFLPTLRRASSSTWHLVASPVALAVPAERGSAHPRGNRHRRHNRPRPPRHTSHIYNNGGPVTETVNPCQPCGGLSLATCGNGSSPWPYPLAPRPRRSSVGAACGECCGVARSVASADGCRRKGE